MWQLSSDMFTPAIPVAEKILRPVVVYVFLVVLLRVFGKRELAQLNPFDLVVLLSLSNTVQNAIIGNDNSVTGGLIGAFSLLAVNYVVVRFLFRHRRLDQIMEGTPTVLIEHGRVQRRALAKELLTEPELLDRGFTGRDSRGWRRWSDVCSSRAAPFPLKGSNRHRKNAATRSCWRDWTRSVSR